MDLEQREVFLWTITIFSDIQDRVKEMDSSSVHRQREWIIISEYNRQISKQNINSNVILGHAHYLFRYLLSTDQEMIHVRNAVDAHAQDLVTNVSLLLPIPDHLWPA